MNRGGVRVGTTTQSMATIAIGTRGQPLLMREGCEPWYQRIPLESRRVNHPRFAGFAGHRPPQGDSISETSGFSGGSEAVAQHTTAVESQLPRGIKRELNPEFLAPSAAMRLNSYRSNAHSSERGIDEVIPRVEMIKLEEVEDGPMPKRIKMEDQEHEITRGFKLEDDDQEIRDW